MAKFIPFENPMGTDGFEFIEFAARDVETMTKKFEALGFHHAATHPDMDVRLFKQGDINFIVNNQPESMAQNFAKLHGESVSAMGFRVKDATAAYDRALRLGARAYAGERGAVAFDVPVIYGIGESLIYFIDDYNEKTTYDHFNALAHSEHNLHDKHLMDLDHVTHNVFRGQMDVWAEFYERLFNFREIRFFDIKGLHTGLISRALTSPCGKIRIPLNESTDDASQIEEYLREYNGEGIQHIALSSRDIYQSVPAMRLAGVPFLKIPDTYYEQVNDRVPGHQENVTSLQENQILIDGNAETDEGILLQLFTENHFGPVFFEIIQRKGNEGFGEGNFRALFVAMEADQIRRGVLNVD